MDDILIFSRTRKEHRKHVHQVFSALREAGLYLDIDKCEFFVSEVKYLGLIIGQGEIRMNPRKVKAILEWEPPPNLQSVQSFLGFANFYRRFIKDFSRLAAPLSHLTKKNVPFEWSSAAQGAFEALKECFATAPVLRIFDPEREGMLETDSSDHIVAGVFSQLFEDGLWHPIAYFSAKMQPAECNYEIYDKKLLAIIRCLKEWRSELEGSIKPIRIITDHKNLEYFMTTKRLSARQARWAEFVSRFNFIIEYRPGKLNLRADALTRRAEDRPGENDSRKQMREQTLLKSEYLAPEVQEWLSSRHPSPGPDLDLRPARASPAGSGEEEELFVASPGSSNDDAPGVDTSENSDDGSDPEGRALSRDELEDLFDRAYRESPQAQEVIQALQGGLRRLKKFPLGECSLREGRIYYRKQLFVPELDELRLQVVRSCHDLPAAGHPGEARTMKLVSRQYWWPNWTVDVRRYIRNCDTCTRAKSSRQRHQGALLPLEAPERRWEHIAMDFIVDLPASKNEFGASIKDALVVTDRLNKMVHIVPIQDCTAEGTARAFYTHVFKLHGLPRSIVTDRGTQFESELWNALCKRL